MIIRSQDKKKIATLDKCKATESGEVFVNGAFFGNYSTEAKAIKVLDMIQDAYMGSAKWMITYNGKMQQSTVPVVFQMPQDSEVSVE
jgi:hypothetical protein